MKFSRLLVSAGVVLVAFWVLSLLLKLAGWVLQVALYVGLFLVIASLISYFVESRKKS